MNAESSGKSPSADGAGPQRGAPTGSRAPRFVRRSPALLLTWRIVIFVLGLAIVAGGVVLLPLPGPGWLVVFAGFGVWATEFAWAQRVLSWVKRRLKEGGRWVRRRFGRGGTEGGGAVAEGSAEHPRDAARS